MKQVQSKTIKILVSLIPPINSDASPYTIKINLTKITNVSQLRAKVASKYSTLPQLITLIHNNKCLLDEEKVNIISLQRDPKIYVSITWPNKQQSLEQIFGKGTDLNTMKGDNSTRYLQEIQQGNQQQEQLLSSSQRRQNNLNFKFRDDKYQQGNDKRLKIKDKADYDFFSFKAEIKRKINQVEIIKAINQIYQKGQKKMEEMGFNDAKLRKQFLQQAKGDVSIASDLYVMYEQTLQ